MPAANVTAAARKEFGRMTARRNPPARNAAMRCREPRFQATTCLNTPVVSRSVATFAGAATAMPPSARKRCCSALYVGRARTLSPTQLRPMTTVSHTIVLAFSRPFPAIVHPEPELGTVGDAARDHVVHVSRQHLRAVLSLCEIRGPNRLDDLDAMPQAVRDAKSEHNRRVGPQRHLRRSGSRPRRTSEKRDQNAFSRQRGLVAEKEDDGILGEAAHQDARRTPAIDDRGSGARAQLLQIAL